MAPPGRKRSGRPPTFQDLRRTDLARKEYRAVYLFVGEDTLRIEQVAAHLRDGLLGPAEAAFNYSVFHGENTPVEAVLARAMSYPMLGDKQVLWLKEIDEAISGPDAEKAIFDYLAHPVPTTLLILSGSRVDGRKKWVRHCRELGLYFDFSPPKGGEVAAWVRKTAQKAGLDLPEPLPTVLIELVGEDLHALTAEINKLALLGEDSGAPFTKEKVEELVMQQGIFDEFKLVNALKPADPVPALKVWFNLSDWGKRPMEMAPLLLWRIRKLVLAGALGAQGVDPKEAAQLAGMRSWMYEQVERSAGDFGTTGLARMLREAHRFDGSLKRSAIPDDLALERAILGICNS